MNTPCSLQALNAAPTRAAFAALLAGLYEHSPWIAEHAFDARPFATPAALQQALIAAVRAGGHDAQLALLRAHPELAGKAMVAKALTAASSHEQSRSGLTQCTPAEFERLQALNRDYNARFGFPFILAIGGARGTGLSRTQIIDTFARRLHNPADFEFAEALRQVHRIAELRLAALLGTTPEHGNRVWDWAERLAAHSEPPYAERGELTVTYLSDAHRAVAADLRLWMHAECGFDTVTIDAVGNVVGLYHGQQPQAPRLLSGSHYDTVRNAGRYDGRLGVLVPMACVRALAQAGRRLPLAIEVVAFAEEEGQRYAATFLGSSALTGSFDAAWLDQQDAAGITLRTAMTQAGLDIDAIPALARDATRYLGFVEVHIEQGPVLNALDLPLAAVSSINGSLRYQIEITGLASHAGTTPMNQRRDAAAAAAELLLFAERRARAAPGLVATVGMLEVPGGSINVVPGRCCLSLDVRAPSDEARDACARDVLTELDAIAARRGTQHRVHETLRAAAAPSDPAWQARWERALQRLGLPAQSMASGAGHDAMKLHALLPQAMLFVRGENAGISHNPLESTTSHDIDLCVQAMQALLEDLAAENA